MSQAVYPTLRSLMKGKLITPREVESVIAASAEGYPFPADLDIDSPLTGMAPQSQQEIMREALAEDWEPSRFNEAIASYEQRRTSDRSNRG